MLLIQLIVSFDSVLVVKPSNCIIRCNLRQYKLLRARFKQSGSSSKQLVDKTSLLSDCLAAAADLGTIAEVMITWQV